MAKTQHAEWEAQDGTDTDVVDAPESVDTDVAEEPTPKAAGKSSQKTAKRFAAGAMTSKDIDATRLYLKEIEFSPLLTAGAVDLLPTLATTFLLGLSGLAAATTVLGVIPLFFDAFFQSMAVVLVFGLTFATVLTLLIIPVLYAIFFGIHKKEQGNVAA